MPQNATNSRGPSAINTERVAQQRAKKRFDLQTSPVASVPGGISNVIQVSNKPRRRQAALQAGTVGAGKRAAATGTDLSPTFPPLPKTARETSLPRSQRRQRRRKLARFAVQMGALAGRWASASCIPRRPLPPVVCSSLAAPQDAAVQSSSGKRGNTERIQRGRRSDVKERNRHLRVEKIPGFILVPSPASYFSVLRDGKRTTVAFGGTNPTTSKSVSNSKPVASGF